MLCYAMNNPNLFAVCHTVADDGVPQEATPSSKAAATTQHR